MKFIATKELGRLAKWLRILGHDTIYYTRDERADLILTSLREERTILTRNTKLSRYGGIRTVHIKSDHLKEQLRQAVKELALKLDDAQLFTRCVICNVELVTAEKRGVKDLVPAYVYKTQEEFARCPKCKRIYWSGSHWNNMKEVVELVWK